MGAWGTGIFDNDAALDFVGTVVETNDLSSVTKVFDEILAAAGEQLDSDLAERGLVVAEIVAALRGYAGDLPEELEDWVADKDAVSTEMRIYAHGAVLRILNHSELRELWEESEAFEEWRQTVRDLLRRLTARKAGEAWPQKKAKGKPKMTPYLCCYCAEPIREDDLATLSIQKEGEFDVTVWAHTSCMEEKMILTIKGDQ
jgi:hypothetical protein